MAKKPTKATKHTSKNGSSAPTNTPQQQDLSGLGSQLAPSSSHIFMDPASKTLWSDQVVFQVAQGKVCLRFLSIMPEGRYELARIMIDQEHGRRIVDLLSHVLDHSPRPVDDQSLRVDKASLSQP